MSNKKPKYSIVTCVSDYEIYEKCLLKSLRLFRNHDNLYEVIPIDNRNNAYSAAEACNLGMMISNSDYIIVCHQDISLLNDFFSKLDLYIKKLRKANWGILGCAGVAIDSSKNVGKIYNTFSSDNISESIDKKVLYYDGLSDLTEVYSIDECLFVINKKPDIRFSNELRGFHLYGVDLCFNYSINGYKIYAAELPVIHYGEFSGSMIYDKDYWKSLRSTVYKWKDHVPVMHGTYADWDCSSKDSLIITSHLKTHTETPDFTAHILKSCITEVVN